MRERGFATLDQLVAAPGRRPRRGRSPTQVIEALLNNETYFFRDRLPFDLLLGGPVQAARDGARAKREAARHLVRRLLDRPGSLFAGDELRRREGALAGLDDRHRRHRPVARRDRARPQRRLFAVRGAARPAGHADDPLVRASWAAATGGSRTSCATRSASRSRNLIEPPPRPGTFDIILCRNVLLYFSPEMRRLAFNRLAEALRAATAR